MSSNSASSASSCEDPPDLEKMWVVWVGNWGPQGRVVVRLWDFPPPSLVPFWNEKIFQGMPPRTEHDAVAPFRISLRLAS